MIFDDIIWDDEVCNHLECLQTIHPGAEADLRAPAVTGCRSSTPLATLTRSKLIMVRLIVDNFNIIYSVKFFFVKGFILEHNKIKTS